MSAQRTNPDACCPTCRVPLDAAMAHDELAHPEPGDLAVCFHCGCLLQFHTDLRLHELPGAVFASLDEETRATLVRFQNHVRRMS